MNKKAKFSTKVKSVFYKFVGRSRSYAIHSYVLRRKFKTQSFSFPVKSSTINEILIILPEQQIDVLYQLKNFISIVTSFSHSTISVFCEESVSAFVKMIPNISIVEYQKEDREKFSAEFIEACHSFKNQTDLCFLLERNPDFSILYLVGLTGAPIRTGYENAGDYPYLNLRARSTQKKKYIPDQNYLITKLFGLQSEVMKMNVGKKMLDEIEALINGTHLKNNRNLVGIDALFFLRRFGQNWFEKFLDSLHLNYKGGLYLFVSESATIQEQQWLKNQRDVFFSELSPPKTAALIHKTDLVIAGNTAMYGFATIFNVPAVGFFTEEELEAYCPNSQRLRGLLYKDLPDDISILNVISQVSMISA